MAPRHPERVEAAKRLREVAARLGVVRRSEVELAQLRQGHQRLREAHQQEPRRPWPVQGRAHAPEAVAGQRRRPPALLVAALTPT